MELAHLIAFNIALLGALASPGPAFLALMQCSLRGGIAGGVLCALGLGIAACAWSLLAILGLGALFAVVPWAWMALKLAGAAYLIYLAVKIWRGAAQPLPPAAQGGARGLRTGLAVNLANPKAVFFIAAIYATVFPEMPRGAEAALVLANHLVLEVLWYGACALVFSAAPVRAGYLRAKAWLDRAAAAVLGLLALRIAT